VIGGATVYE